MPDWSYHPLLRPLLFRLPPERGRDVALGVLGQVGRMPTGPQIIQLLGHMQLAPTHARTLMGLRFPGAVGIGDGFDSAGVATAALSRLGVGFVEVGPVSLAPIPNAPLLRDEATLLYPAPLGNEGAAALLRRLRDTPLPVPLALRLTPNPDSTAAEAAEELRQLVATLAPCADCFTLDCRAGIADGRWPQAEWGDYLEAVANACAAHARPLALCLPPDLEADARKYLLARAADLPIAGILLGGGLAQPNGARLFGEATHAPTLAALRALREQWGSRFALLASGGSHAPAQALELLEAGADLLLLHSGIVFSGPGLPKRINEALAFYHPAPAPPRASTPFWQQGWLWAFLLGLGMIASGLAAWFVALTSVLLPYDEAFLGLARAELLTLSPRLLPFMAHDRVALAGTMISIGILYACLAAFGLRAGLHWAWKALGWSGTIGFLTFFLFLGYGYFDPLHAALSVMLLPLFLLGLWQARGQAAVLASPNLHNDGRWLRGQWGQALFVALGVALVVSGLTIMVVGVTSVFVPEDLRFMQTTRDYLCSINPRLVPLVAHDRAGFGGALLSDGVAVLLCALWGFRQGARWLWWMLAAAGGIGFLGAIGIHFVVGYTDFWHLSPALIGLLIFLAGLTLSYGYLCAPESDDVMM